MVSPQFVQSMDECNFGEVKENHKRLNMIRNGEVRDLITRFLYLFLLYRYKL